MGDDPEQLLRHTYAVFNAREIDAVLAMMHPDVDWPNAIDGGRLHGHDAVRAYWHRQFAEIDPRVDPVGFRRLDDGRVAVDVHQTVRSLDGEQISAGDVVHVYAFRDGLVSRMDIDPVGDV